MKNLDEKLRRHKHTGVDGTSVLNRRFQITVFLAQGTANLYFTTFWNVPFPCSLLEVNESHSDAGTDAGAVGLVVEKLTGTTAPGSGFALTSSQSLKSAVNTVTEMQLTTDRKLLTLLKDDRLALKLTGTPTGVNGVVVTLLLERL
jgi:hypothetical protein